MKKEKILIIVITVLTTAIISTIVLVPMISRLMGETREPSSESMEETKKNGIKLPSFSMNKKTKEETKEKTSEEEKEIEKIEESLEMEEESTEEMIETSPASTTESVIETVVETTPIPETTISGFDTTTSPSPSETKSQVFLGEDMKIINAGLERTGQMTSIKEQIKKLMSNEIPQEVAQEVYDLASEGQMLAIANIDTFSYIIGADAEGKFSYMDDEARVLNITCFKQDIEMYRNDYAEFQTYIDWANLFITN